MYFVLQFASNTYCSILSPCCRLTKAMCFLCNGETAPMFPILKITAIWPILKIIISMVPILTITTAMISILNIITDTFPIFRINPELVHILKITALMVLILRSTAMVLILNITTENLHISCNKDKYINGSYFEDNYNKVPILKITIIMLPDWQIIPVIFRRL